MLDQKAASSLQVDLHDILSPPRRLSSPMVVGLHGGGVMPSSRHQFDRTKPGSLFPDEEHSYEPRRHVRFAALNRNALPCSEPARSRRTCPRNSPKRKKVSPPALQQQDSLQFPISLTVQALRKKHGHKKPPNRIDKESAENQQVGHPAREYDDDPAACELWGFPVKYSPKKQLEAQWRAIGEQNQHALCVKPEQATQREDTATRSHQESKRNEADYARYLYLASLYGPLDALLYCCCQPGSHGRVYMLLVDICARRIQRWAPQRVSALRRYWIGCLARKIATTSITEGLETIVHSFQQERQASALFLRLKLLRAARAFRAWCDYSSRMIRLRDKMRLALTKDLESRFYRWRYNVETRKRFKTQLKRIAKRKAMQNAFVQWQCWRSQHEKLRRHLAQRRLQTKRESWKMWYGFARCNRAARRLQRLWRVYSWRKQRYTSVRTIQRVYRGWRGRHKMKQLRDKMAIHSVLLRVTDVAAWEVRCAVLTKQRRLLLERELIRARHQAEYVVQAEKQAAVLVEPELSKAVRNAMHRKLDKHLQLLRENDTEVPTQLVKTSSYLRRVAVQNVIDDERASARQEAIEAFRVTNGQHGDAKANPCIVCQVYADFHNREPMDASPLSDGHTCLSEYSIGTGDVLAELEIWENTTHMELTKLERCEQDYTVALFASDPTIASLWESLSKEQKIAQSKKL